MKRAAVGILVVVAIAAVALALVRAYSGSSEAARPEEVITVGRRDVGRVVKATGVIRARTGAEVRVGSRVSGVVKRLHVRVGDAVVQGHVLAELDDRELMARRDEAAAALALSGANLRYADADLQRRRSLAAAELLPRSDLDVAERGRAVAEQQSAQAQASLEYAATQLGYTRIVAPMSGVVASVATQEGETVAASFAAPTFLTLIDLSRLEVRAYVDETDIGRIRVGQDASFTVDTYPDELFPGRVTTIYPEAEIRDNVVNYVAVVHFAPPRARTLRPEMTAVVRIALDVRRNVIAVPLRAVRYEAGRPFVQVRRGATIERRSIVNGIHDDTFVEIVEGLREGEQIVIEDTTAGRKANALD